MPIFVNKNVFHFKISVNDSSVVEEICRGLKVNDDISPGLFNI